MKYRNILIILLFICLLTMGAVNATNATSDIQTNEVLGDTSINNYDDEGIENTVTTDKSTNNDIKTVQDSNNENDFPISDVYTIVTDNIDAHQDTEIDLFADVFADNKTVNEGKVYFLIDDNAILDKNGSVIYSSVKNNLTHQRYYVPATLALGDHNITAIYLSTENTRAIDTKTFTITDDNPSGVEYDRYEPDTIYDPAVVSYTLTSNAKNNNVEKTTGTNTHKIIHNNNIISQGNAITLEILNKIFGQTFTNGHLLVYVDGELVYNGTTTDDLSCIIFEIIEKFIGEHEIKVEFTDNNNNTDTFTEKITLE